jgi:hypothetical protein
MIVVCLANVISRFANRLYLASRLRKALLRSNAVGKVETTLAAVND